MSRRFAFTLFTSAFVLGILLAAPLWAAKGGGGKPPKDDPPPEPPPFEYALQLLEVVGGQTDVYGMNDAGEIVGESGNEAVLWIDSGQTLIRLNNLLPEGSDWLLFRAVDINNAGQIVGYGFLPNIENARTFRYTPGDGTEPPIVEDLSSIGIDPSGLSINNLGDVTGNFVDSEGAQRGVVYTGVPGQLDADQIEVIPLPENGQSMSWMAINDLGQVTGRVTLDTLVSYAFRYTPASEGTAAQIELFTLYEPKKTFSPFRSYGFDINISGQVAGVSNVKGDPYHAYRHSEITGGEDLGVLSGGDGSWADALNDDGDVVGWSKSDVGSRGFIYLDGFGMVNLDDLVVGDDADLAIWNANSIDPVDINERAVNSWGQVTGTIEAGPNVPFLLTPQPLP